MGGFIAFHAQLYTIYNLVFSLLSKSMLYLFYERAIYTFPLSNVHTKIAFNYYLHGI